MSFVLRPGAPNTILFSPCQLRLTATLFRPTSRPPSPSGVRPPRAFSRRGPFSARGEIVETLFCLFLFFFGSRFGGCVWFFFVWVSSFLFFWVFFFFFFFFFLFCGFFFFFLCSFFFYRKNVNTGKPGLPRKKASPLIPLVFRFSAVLISFATPDEFRALFTIALV